MSTSANIPLIVAGGGGGVSSDVVMEVAGASILPNGNNGAHTNGSGGIGGQNEMEVLQIVVIIAEVQEGGFNKWNSRYQNGSFINGGNGGSKGNYS